jgi:S-adenosylmethionine hydrolase
MEASALPTKIVTLTTDFGLSDPYVAEMKAVILSLCPNVTIVDVTHEIEKFNIRMGAFVLASVTPYFPKGTIHVVVVDPGVGTQRRSLIMQTRNGFFVGPDNGILFLAAEKQGIIHIHDITNRKLMLPHVSNTFHGRDIFAPAAAHLANGVLPADFGPEIQEVVKPEFTKVASSKGVLKGEVLHIDGFGNIITNISKEDLKHLHIKASINVELANSEVKLKLGKTYAETNEVLLIIGSHGYVEIAVNQGNAAEKFKAKPGDAITLSSA